MNNSNKMYKHHLILFATWFKTGDSAWGAFAQRVLNDGINPRQGKKSDQAHPPIHPTKYAANLSNEKERKLYEYIVRHFLACVSKDAQVSYPFIYSFKIAPSSVCTATNIDYYFYSVGF